ncbi:T9SS type A sorting domain-containing protein [Flavitalea sp. BT771]|uniref:T9SS type A sorting domain-containing protein n=1 Tax=Flavitalea sp. BT771 TaxID=3063329 RepID=UPI0026E24E45|nr:T9SS type A sorting domain-containing protein [Flavitalea sp. BT771]MDO6429445.1 T9SS type A sorting domain-containing protein [Flavitalea sp. BT771]MDV6218427.1 T9SS type A sorting domain-containing protein [Flavitalea sp. BT771]
MNVSLLRKRYNVLIIPLLLLLLLYSDVVQATPACPIVSQTFQNSANGDISDPSATGWYLDRTNVTNAAAVFSVQSHRIKAQALGGEGVWYSQVFSIAGYTNIQVDAKVSSEGTFTSSEYVKVYYKLDNGPETLISAQFGSFGTPTVTSPMMTGSTVQIVIRIYNFSAGNNDYYIEKYDVFKETGPCTVTGISVSAGATNSGVLTCTNPSTTLTASTTATGTTTYAWTGPNGYTANGSSVSVSTAGTYTVTGTNSAGTGSASVTVTANNTAPDVTATGGALGCASSTIISANSSVSGVTYSWTGPNGFTSTSQSPSVTASGTYTVTVTNPSTGCTASTSATVTTGAAASVFWLEDFTLANGTTSDAGTTPWTSSSDGTGTYTYSVQNNEFKTTFTGQHVGTWISGPISLAGKTNTTLSVDLRSETASSGDLFETADFIRVYLRINNRADSLIYEDLAGIGTSTSGTASMTLTSGAFNGDSVRVIIKTSNSDPTERYYFDNVKLTGTPTGGNAVATGGTITCTKTSVTLSGSTSATGATYSWTGPNSFTSTVQNPTVSTAGVYTLTVTAGGCTSTDTALVVQNTTAPGATSSASGSLTCTTTSVALTGSSSTTGVTYAWTGPGGFTASGANATTSVAGTYTLTVTNPANGCTTLTNTVVAQNISAPGGLSIGSSTGATLLTCTNTSITLTASSSTSGVGFHWSGPNGLSLSSPSVTVTTPGTYLVTATDPSNGCASNSSANVTQNITPPNNLLMTSNPTVAVLTCSTTSIAFNANSSVSGAVYNWAGPSGFTFTGQTTVVNTPGTYSVTATDPTNGCTSTSSAVVTQDITAPQGVATSSVPANGLLTCSNTSVRLTGSSSTTGVTYAWTGPSGFTSTNPLATVTVPGNYTLTVTNPSNGCFVSVTAPTVTQNTNVPGAVSTSVSDKLTCNTTRVKLTGSSTTAGVTYAWVGPNGFTASDSVTNVTAGGVYTLTATDPTNGCSFSRQITVVADQVHPTGVNISADGSLTCDVGSVTLTGSSSTGGVSYTWTGPNGFFDPEQITSVTDSGTYFLTVTNPSNFCNTVASTHVAADFTGCSMIAPKTATGHAASLQDGAAANTAGVSGLTYKVYPNPVSGAAYVNLNAPQKGHVSVAVYNGLGVREQVLFDGVVEAGVNYQWTLDAGRLATGIHYCIIRTHNKVYTSKLLVATGKP